MYKILLFFSLISKAVAFFGRLGDLTALDDLLLLVYIKLTDALKWLVLPPTPTPTPESRVGLVKDL